MANAVTRVLLALAASACAALTAGCAPSLDTRPAAAHETFDARLVEHGRELAAIGDCHGCHTAPGGASFAGGVAIHSRFGTIYSSNITPDAGTGIGGWTEEAFRRALREGVRRDGAHLYPAFPYDRFSLVSDDDAHALYAYIMTRTSVRSSPPPNELAFPFNVRSGLALWNALYLRKPGLPQLSDAELMRGAYLVEGLGHCGSCHSPRNALYAEVRSHAYEGGEQEGWHAYAIGSRNKAPEAWRVDALAFYLANGWHPRHGIARGTMGPLTAELRGASPRDVHAMAAYVVWMMRREEPRDGSAPTALLQPGEARRPGRELYRIACEECHSGAEALPFAGLPLGLSIGVRGESPRNLVNVILHGIEPAAGETSPIMPGFAGALDDGQVVELVTWLRARFTAEPPWQDVRALVRESRAMTRAQYALPPGGAGTDPLDAKAP